MVCNRCIMVVQQLLEEMNISYEAVSLGEIDIDTIENHKYNDFSDRLLSIGFEILNDKEQKIIEKIKVSLNSLINDREKIETGVKLSEFISNKLHYDYNYVSSIFSSNQGITIEKYFIQLKIERAKELLIYNEFTLSEISFALGYSSVAHLSTQFKKTTGLTPSYFKSLKDIKQRKPIDKI